VHTALITNEILRGPGAILSLTKQQRNFWSREKKVVAISFICMSNMTRFCFEWHWTNKNYIVFASKYLTEIGNRFFSLKYWKMPTNFVPNHNFWDYTAQKHVRPAIYFVVLQKENERIFFHSKSQIIDLFCCLSQRWNRAVISVNRIKICVYTTILLPWSKGSWIAIHFVPVHIQVETLRKKNYFTEKKLFFDWCQFYISLFRR
jgi:hypothetical protein